MKKLVFLIIIFMVFVSAFKFNVFAQAPEDNTITIPVQDLPQDTTATEQNQPAVSQTNEATTGQAPIQDVAPRQTGSKVIMSTLSCVKVGNPDESLKATVCKENPGAQQGFIGPILGTGPTVVDCGQTPTGETIQCIKPDYVFYCQGDPRWGNIRNLAGAGCGPTSMAIVLSSYGDTIIPPDMDAIFAQRGWRSDPRDGSRMTTAIETYLPEIGYEYHKVATTDLQRMQEYLNAGYLIIGSTSEHIFVIDGVDPAGNILKLRDPGRCENKDGVYRSASAPWGGQSMTYSYAVKKLAN